MDEQEKKPSPYRERAKDQGTYATKPTGWTRFMRIFFPYQLWRFLVINLKMLRMISKGHH
jgi:hypothetical protein